MNYPVLVKSQTELIWYAESDRREDQTIRWIDLDMESVCRKKIRLLRMPKAKKLLESIKSPKFTAATVESENFHIQEKSQNLIQC